MTSLSPSITSRVLKKYWRPIILFNNKTKVLGLWQRLRQASKTDKRPPTPKTNVPKQLKT
jgi:hypothetical protein